ncbi:MAG: metalloregulator ArsR/SmtB family transcription factor [Candidatus Pacebacteria bacterium]|nr:metalloregulator ArsR/SmtB family transcription factor [Candidatus Paceibacterota bacterium]
MQQEAELFKALSDPTRLRLVVLLATHGEVCVCVMAEALDEPDFKISRHLRILRAAGIVETRREGTWMHYRLAEPRTGLEACLQACFRDCLNDHKTVVADAARLGQASCRKARG